MVAPVQNYETDVAVPGAPAIPSQIYRMTVKQFEWCQTSTGKLACRVYADIKEPAEHAGEYREYLTLGSAEDPQATDPDTKRKGFIGRNWGLLVNIFAAIYGGRDKLPPSDPVQLSQQCVGHDFAPHVIVEKDENGVDRNRFRNVYAVGEKQVGTMATATVERRATAAAGSGAAPPTRPPAATANPGPPPTPLMPTAAPGGNSLAPPQETVAVPPAPGAVGATPTMPAPPRPGS